MNWKGRRTLLKSKRQTYLSSLNTEQCVIWDKIKTIPLCKGKQLASIKILPGSSLKISDFWNSLLKYVSSSQWLLFFYCQDSKIFCPYSSLEIDILLNAWPNHSKTTERGWIHLHQDLVLTSLPKTLSFPWIASCTTTKSGLKCALYKTATLVQKLDLQPRKKPLPSREWTSQLSSCHEYLSPSKYELISNEL